MSEREKAIQLLQELPDTISMKEILETLSTMLEINTRINNFDENEAIPQEELEKEITRKPAD